MSMKKDSTPYHPCTLEAIGQALGVTRQRVQQIEAVALAKLRVECERVGLEPADLVEDWRASYGPRVH